jgi:hypothetical protein
MIEYGVKLNMMVGLLAIRPFSPCEGQGLSQAKKGYTSKDKAYTSALYDTQVQACTLLNR